METVELRELSFGFVGSLFNLLKFVQGLLPFVVECGHFIADELDHFGEVGLPWAVEVDALNIPALEF